MRIAVTGVRGQVGRAVARAAVEQGHRVLGIDRSGPAEEDGPASVAFLAADVTSHDALSAALYGCDAVVHLAAYPTPTSGPGHEVHHNNVVASYNVLSAAADLGIRHVCVASSVNAVNGEFTRWPTYDYFPLDEQHPTSNEDPYSLSKWICEQQADSVARRHSWMTISTLRLHWVVPDRAYAMSRQESSELAVKQLWGYTTVEAASRACLLALTATFTGHERFYVVAPDTTVETPSGELRRRFYPTVPLRRALEGRASFYDCEKAARLLGWHHDR